MDIITVPGFGGIIIKKETSILEEDISFHVLASCSKVCGKYTINLILHYINKLETKHIIIKK